MLNDINGAERRLALRGRRGNMVQRVNRMIMNPNYDPDNDFYDRESDENFELTEEAAEKSEEDEEFDEDNSDEEYGEHSRAAR